MPSVPFLQLKEIAFMGGNLIISASDYHVLQIKELVSAGKQKGISITIRNAQKLTSINRKEIAFLNPTKVTFDFT